MRQHELKIWPPYFEAVAAGVKRHEIRVDDRGFAVGDILRLREWHPGSGTLWLDGSPESCVVDPHHTGRELRVRVTYKSSGGTWELPDKLCVLSIAKELT